jgi:hypothetical protein
MLPKPVHFVNELLAFLLELVAFALLAVWGFHVGHNAAVHVLLGLGAPAAGIVAWGLFAAPRAKFPVPMAAVLVVKALVFGAATAAAFAVLGTGSGVACGAVFLVNTALATADRQSLIRRSRSSAGPADPVTSSAP